MYLYSINSPSYSSWWCMRDDYEKWNNTSTYLNWTIRVHREMSEEYLWLVIIKIVFFQTCFKGQLISKCLFCVFNFFQKTNENKSTWGVIVVKLNSFLRFLEEFTAWQFAFEFYWPLEARVEILTNISFVFWSIWRHQKDISKLTDL